MSTKTKQTYTAGALRAARIIAGDDESAIYLRGADDENGWHAQEDYAAMISRETGDLEMLAALELLLSEMRQGQYSPSLGAMQQVYAAVCKAKGEV